MVEFINSSISMGSARNELAQYGDNRQSALRNNLSMIEQGRHEELATVYDRIKAINNENSIISAEERLELIKTLVSGTFASNKGTKPDFEIEKIESVTPTLAKTVSKYLSSISKDYIKERQISGVAAIAAEALLAGKSSKEVQKIIDTSLKKYNDALNFQLERDYNRNHFVIQKNGEFIEVFPEGTKCTVEQFRNKLKEINAEKDLGLTGEQIDFISITADQKSYGDGSLSWHAENIRNNGLVGCRDIKYQETIQLEKANENGDRELIQERSESGYLIDISDNNITIKTNRGFTGLDDNLETISTIVNQTSIDITSLKGSELIVGMGSAPVEVNVNFAATNYNISLPEEYRSVNSNNNLKEFCRVKVATQCLSNDIDSMAKLLKNQTHDSILLPTFQALKDVKNLSPDQTIELAAKVSGQEQYELGTVDQMAEFAKKVNPALLKETFQALKDVKNLSYKDQSELALKACSKENRVDLKKATELLMSSNPDLDTKRARRYMISMADNLGIKTNISFGERISNLYSNISDRINGQKNPEQKLIGVKVVPEMKVVTIPTPEIPKKSRQNSLAHSVVNGFRKKGLGQNKSSSHRPGTAQANKASGRGV